MGEPNYGRRVAEAILRYAHAKYLRVDKSGVWNDFGRLQDDDREDGTQDDFGRESETESPEARLLGWHPLCELDRPGSPDPLDEPSLPFPFTARQLAAFMVDGVGSLVCDAFGDWHDGPDEAALSALGVRATKAREALRAAYNAFLECETAVGVLNVQLDARVQQLAKQWRLNNSGANAKEGVHDRGLGSEDYRARRARARASIGGLDAELTSAKDDAERNHAGWRKAIVCRLLGTGGTAPVHARPKQVSRAQEHAIVEWLRSQKHDPLRLPKSLNGNRTIKAQTRDDLVASSRTLFNPVKFDKAWLRLAKEGRIKWQE